MPRLMIDNKKVEVQDGVTVLSAARKLGIEIPTLCHANGLGHFTSCMVCVVRDKLSNRLLPSCTAPAADGLVIETGSDAVKEARGDALGLLLREHIGDCEAPCTRACPAHLDIPGIIRKMKKNEIQGALQLLYEYIPFPEITAHVCPAFCESACRRAQIDGAVSIRRLIRILTEESRREQVPFYPQVEPPSGNKVAIIGAGPAGLSASLYLSLKGHRCTIYDERDIPGDVLRYDTSESSLPLDLLHNEIRRLQSLGVVFRMKVRVGRDIVLDDLISDHDAVVVATEDVECELHRGTAIEKSNRRIKENFKKYMTGEDGVFVCEYTVKKNRPIAKIFTEGRDVASLVNRYLRGEKLTGNLKRFYSHIGKIRQDELEEFLKEAKPCSRISRAESSREDFNKRDAIKEAGRCLHCDCRKKHDCKLRQLAEEYGAHVKYFGKWERKRYEKITHHPDILFEPGKCIKCGLCVRITTREGEKLGLAFVGRGYDVRVGVPFDDLLSKAIEKSADQCVMSCPTGALSFRDI